MSKCFTVQIHTGGFDTEPENLDIPIIKRKLSKLYSNAHIDCVMIGWNPGAAVDDIIYFIKEHGTDVYLWLPVFSGLDGFTPLIGTDGNPVVHNYKAEKGERFDFGCPVDPKNIIHIKRFFEANFNNGVYDGIFLDKIRYPSFISGLDPVLTCFCSHCQQIHNLSRDIKTSNSENPLGIISYNDLHYNLDSSLLTGLFQYKSKTITEAITDISKYFRDLGYKIGLDLFAPYLSFFVGQDYTGLAPNADFIKPMFYRKTLAPAGLPFELDMYASAFGGDIHRIESRKQYLLDVLRTPSIDVDFINREINNINRVLGDTKHYAGIEINYNKKIAPVTTDYIHENITGLQNVDGFALSWDLCSTPDENIDAVIDALT